MDPSHTGLVHRIESPPLIGSLLKPERELPTRLAALLVLVTWCLLPATSVLAVSEGAPAIYQPLLVTSARSSALGEVSAVIEESGISGWRNPGFLAFDRKMRATGTETQLVPDLADDIWLRSVLVSASVQLGVPITFAAGYAKLDFGTNTIVNDAGVEIGSFESYDRTFNLSAAAQFWETIGAGVTLEHVYSKLAEPIPELNIADGDGEAVSVSLGAAVRRKFTFPPGESDASVFTITPLAGISLLHWGGEIDYGDQAEKLPKQLHVGAGLRVAHEARFAKRFFDPMRLSNVSIAGYIEKNKPKVGDDDERIMHYGGEITVCGIVSYRFGHIDDPDGDITDDTHGWGVGIEDVLPFDVRLDYASIPQATDLDRVERWDVMVSFDPRFLGDE